MEEGLVIKSTGSFSTVLLDSGDIVECKVRGKFRMKDIKTTNPVAVGDRVEVLVDADENTSWIVGLHERKNYIIRKSINLSKQFHILASNMDQALVVATVASPRTSTGFIDRFLVTAEAYSIPPFIVFNKVDILTEETRGLQDWFIDLYTKAGYECYEVSAATGVGLDVLLNKLKGKITLFTGHSGTGKSTLINTIDPELHLRTGIISVAHDKGKHTTTFAEMFQLKNGGAIIDTPGIKELGLVEMAPEELSSYFPDIYKYQGDCKYTNCMHDGEPGCAVLQAAEDGNIEAERYSNYLAILADLKEQKQNLY
ncbi:MAG: ribosome small subunit-dependent GTPase A [Sphingobacteriales bacterium JAD_PAG50586_3]|nr:MAG: ribosome small subunit-dependent GTPase A [Sphingobacteriales bacterium JAD_PAG50586_3]